MKKLLLSILTLATAAASAQNVNIPDANFKAYLVGNSSINTNSDSEIQVSEANAFSGTINLTSSGAADLTGIEEFINLDAFICTYNGSITNFDLSSNTALTKVDIYDAPLLTSVDLSSNTNITYLRLESCYNLASMNISNCTLVDTLNIGASAGFNYDFSVFPNLKWLNCYWTNPGSNTFNLSGNPLLEFLDASYNSSMSALDLTANTNLKSLNISNSNFTSINYSYLTSLERLRVDENSITAIDVSQNTALTQFYCDENLLTSIDVSNNLLLEMFTCTDNQLTSLDVTNNTQLTQLKSSENQLSSIDLSANNLLEVLTLGSNLFTSLSISNPNLYHLDCSGNMLTTLDISQLTSITSLFCQNNDLTTLNVANGNNANFVPPGFGSATPFYAINNPNLLCIQVDDATYSTTNWTNIDATASFSESCATVGIEEEETFSFGLYPNPTNGVFTLSSSETVELVEVFNQVGQKVADFGQVNTIDISNLSDGIYTVKATSNAKVGVARLIKQ